METQTNNKFLAEIINAIKKTVRNEQEQAPNRENEPRWPLNKNEKENWRFDRYNRYTHEYIYVNLEDNNLYLKYIPEIGEIVQENRKDPYSAKFYNKKSNKKDKWQAFRPYDNIHYNFEKNNWGYYNAVTGDWAIYSKQIETVNDYNKNRAVFSNEDDGIYARYRFYNIETAESLEQILEEVEKEAKGRYFVVYNTEEQCFEYYDGEGEISANNTTPYAIYMPEKGIWELKTLNRLYDTFSGRQVEEQNGQYVIIPTRSEIRAEEEQRRIEAEIRAAEEAKEAEERNSKNRRQDIEEALREYQKEQEAKAKEAEEPYQVPQRRQFAPIKFSQLSDLAQTQQKPEEPQVPQRRQYTNINFAHESCLPPERTQLEKVVYPVLPRSQFAPINSAQEINLPPEQTQLKPEESQVPQRRQFAPINFSQLTNLAPKQTEPEAIEFTVPPRRQFETINSAQERNLAPEQTQLEPIVFPVPPKRQFITKSPEEKESKTKNKANNHIGNIEAKTGLIEKIERWFKSVFSGKVPDIDSTGSDNEKNAKRTKRIIKGVSKKKATYKGNIKKKIGALIGVGLVAAGMVVATIDLSKRIPYQTLPSTGYYESQKTPTDYWSKLNENKQSTLHKNNIQSNESGQTNNNSSNSNSSNNSNANNGQTNQHNQEKGQMEADEGYNQNNQDKGNNQSDQEQNAQKEVALTTGSITKQYKVEKGTKYAATSYGNTKKYELKENINVEIFNRAIVQTQKDGSMKVLMTSQEMTWEEFAKKNNMSISEIENMLKLPNTQEMLAISIAGLNHEVFNVYGWTEATNVKEIQRDNGKDVQKVVAQKAQTQDVREL